MTHNPSPAVAAVDPGYGYTKSITAAGAVCFPSIVGEAIKIAYDPGLHAQAGMTVTLGDATWFVGQLAELQSPHPIRPQSRQRDLNLVRLLTLTAIAATGQRSGTLKRLVTGLPVAWLKDRADLVAALTGPAALTYNGAELEYTIQQVNVIPQPAGAFFAQVLTPGGVLRDTEKLAKRKAGVIDIGMHTTDLLKMDSFQYIEKASGSIALAASDFYKALAREINVRYGLEYDLAQAETAARDGEVILWGRATRLPAEMLAACRAPVVQAVREYAKELWPDAREYAAIFVAGGAAPLFVDALREVFPSARLVDEPQTANVRGFWNFAQMQEK